MLSWTLWCLLIYENFILCHKYALAIFVNKFDVLCLNQHGQGVKLNALILSVGIHEFWQIYASTEPTQQSKYKTFPSS